MIQNSHVPDKLEGYALQVRHALRELICFDDRIVSVESYDDVAIETDDAISVEQMKNVLSDNNPITNKAVAFWKTFYNWCNYFKAGEFPLKSVVLKYVIVSSHSLNIGSIPKAFCDSKTETEALEAIEKARAELYCDFSEPQVSKECKEYVQFCFDENNREVLVQTILNFMIEVHEDTYDNELRTLFYKQPIPEEYADQLFITMLGWVTEKVHQFTKLNKPAYIYSKDYRHYLKAEERVRNSNTIFCAISNKPERSQTNEELAKRDVYIRQLEIINADETEKYRAANDYLRTKTEKTLMAQRGLICETSFEDYLDSLRRDWENRKGINDLENYPNAEIYGKALFRYCSIDVGNIRLQGADMPPFFGQGTLHALANNPSDEPEIGWHPDYINKLKEH